MRKASIERKTTETEIKTVDGELVYSKLKTGQFPDEQKILDKLTAKL